MGKVMQKKRKRKIGGGKVYDKGIYR